MKEPERSSRKSLHALSHGDYLNLLTDTDLHG